MEQQGETEAKSGADKTADICTAATKLVVCNCFIEKLHFAFAKQGYVSWYVCPALASYHVQTCSNWLHLTFKLGDRQEVTSL